MYGLSSGSAAQIILLPMYNIISKRMGMGGWGIGYLGLAFSGKKHRWRG